VVHSSKRVKAHDEIVCSVGDEVQIVETRPISAGKFWVVEKVVRRASGGESVVIKAEAKAEAEAAAEAQVEAEEKEE
jgi:small subunit ribosomal protein S17